MLKPNQFCISLSRLQVFFLALGLAFSTQATEPNCRLVTQDFYQSIPTGHIIEGVEQRIFIDSYPSLLEANRFVVLKSYYQAFANHMWREGGLVRARYTPESKTLTVFQIRAIPLTPLTQVRAPSIVHFDGIEDSIPGRGTPTMTLMTLHQMRHLEIAAGSLKKMIADTVINEATNAHIATRPGFKEALARGKTAEFVAQHLKETKLGRYHQSVAELSGHRITKIQVVATKVEYVSGFDFNRLKEQVEASVYDTYEKSLREVGVFPTSYNVIMNLEPITAHVP